MNKKKFELVITIRKVNSFRIDHHCTIHADSLIELCAKIPLYISEIAEELKNEELLELRMQHDDIPF